MIFLDLGSQPLANEYLNKKNINKPEKKYRLLVDFNNKNTNFKKKWLNKFSYY